MELPVITTSRVESATAIRLLVVDDDSCIFDYFEEICPPPRFVVVTASDGPSAERLLQRDGFDVAFVDYFLEGTTGPEVSRLLHRKQPALPVVLMSGFFSGERQKVMEDAGAVDFLVKPVTAENVRTIIERLTGK